jgi:hypothetical protein
MAGYQHFYSAKMQSPVPKTLPPTDQAETKPQFDWKANTATILTFCGRTAYATITLLADHVGWKTTTTITLLALVRFRKKVLKSVLIGLGLKKKSPPPVPLKPLQTVTEANGEQAAVLTNSILANVVPKN